MFTNLAKPTKAMKDKMEELGISITDSNGKMLPMRDVMGQLRDKFKGLSKDQQASAAATIFGKEAMSGALAVINASDEDYKNLPNLSIILQVHLNVCQMRWKVESAVQFAK